MRHTYRPIVTICRRFLSQSKNTNPSKGSPKKAKATETMREVPSATSSGLVDDGTYKSPEYYAYNTSSFYDIQMQMSQYRLKQPSNKSK